MAIVLLTNGVARFSPKGEYLSFASPKERYQRKGDPGIARKPGSLANFEANAQTRGSLPSNRSDMRIFKTSKPAKLPAHFTGTPRAKSKAMLRTSSFHVVEK